MHNSLAEARPHPAKLDEGKQTERVHVLDGIGPLVFVFPGVDASEKGLVEMRHGGDIPGVTSQGACAETAYVIGKIDDDHFDDLLGKPGSGGRVRRQGPWRGTP